MNVGFLQRDSFDPKLMVFTTIGTALSLFVAFAWRDVFKTFITPWRSMNTSKREKWSVFSKTLALAVVSTILGLALAYGMYRSMEAYRVRTTT